MSIGTKLDEGRFKGRFDTRYTRLINGCFLLLPGSGFDVEVVEFLAVDKSDPQLFELGRVDEHTLHVAALCRGCRPHAPHGSHECFHPAAGPQDRPSRAERITPATERTCSSGAHADLKRLIRGGACTTLASWRTLRSQLACSVPRPRAASFGWLLQGALVRACDDREGG